MFRLLLPLEIEMVDPSSISKPADGAPPEIVKIAADAEAGEPLAAARRQALQQVVGPDGIVVVGALRPSDVPEERRPVITTLTVAFAEQIKGMPTAAQFPIPDPDNALHHSQTQLELSDQAILITHGAMLPAPGPGIGGKEGLLLMMWQYLLQTRHGALAMAFGTIGMDVLGPRTTDLMMHIVDTATLDTR